MFRVLLSSSLSRSCRVWLARLRCLVSQYLPAERLVENHVLDTLRETFELHGFSLIETRSVETIEQLLRKGEIDREVYAISRLQEDEAAKAKENWLCTLI